MKVPFVDLCALHEPIRYELLQAVDGVLDGCIFIGGPKLLQFEREFAEFCMVKNAVGMSSGTDALLACLMAEKIGPGDEVITTPYTFIATADVIARVGAKPVFVDIDPITYNIDPALSEAAITDKTKAIIPVDLFGQPCEIAEIMHIARTASLVVIEDAAQAIDAYHKQKKIGSIADYTCFSFFPTKNLGGFGDSGIVTTHDNGKAEKLYKIQRHGSTHKHNYTEIGGNFRLDAMQAALLSVKLKHAREWSRLRQIRANTYKQLLSVVCYNEFAITPIGKSHNTSVYNQFVISCAHRDDLRKYLTTRGIATDIYYPKPLHLQPCFKYLGYKEGQLPNSESLSKTSLALPIHPTLSEEAQKYIVKSIEEFYN